MPVKNVTHDDTGEMKERIPVKYKVALGLPKGGIDPETKKKLGSPKKLFYFLLQNRNDKGEWTPDEGLNKMYVNSKEKPVNIDIVLIAPKIEDMLKVDLSWWDPVLGNHCSCGTLKTYFQDWCELNGVEWTKDLSKVRSVLELKMLIKQEKAPEELNGFIKAAEQTAEKFNDDLPGTAEIVPDEFLNISVAQRKHKGGIMSYPCAHYKCPDFANNKCKVYGRFFFSFANEFHHGEIAHVVTTSPKNVQQLQYSLKKNIENLIKSKSPDLNLYGAKVRLVGQPVRGTYSDGTKMMKTTFFLISVEAPLATSIAAARDFLIKDVEEFTGIDFDFDIDEGTEDQLAKERTSEFVEPVVDPEDIPKTGQNSIKDGDKMVEKEKPSSKPVDDNFLSKVVVGKENTDLVKERVRIIAIAIDKYDSAIMLKFKERFIEKVRGKLAAKELDVWAKMLNDKYGSEGINIEFGKDSKSNNNEEK